MLDDADLDIPEEKPSGNRSFRLIAGILGVILLLAIIGAAIYTFVILPGQQADDLPEDVLSAGLTLTAEALAPQETATDTVEPSATPTPTATRTATSPPPTEEASATMITPIFTLAVNAQTATVNALLTQAALSQTEVAGTSTPADGTPSSILATVTLPSTLPQSGFADDVGLPGLFGATALLLIIILLTRRMRTARR